MTLASVVPTGLAAGTWIIDPSHSEVSFSLRHMGLFKVRGSFAVFTGQVVVDEQVEKSSVAVEVQMDSVDTRDPNRDGHLRSPDFFDVEKFPVMTFRSSSVRVDGDRPVLVGELTVKDVTRPFELAVEPLGVIGDPMGKQRSGFLATGELSRADFGITFNIPMAGNDVVIGDKVQVSIEVQAVLDDGQAAGQA
ncbi:YceI family protein [Actinoplanes sp. NPDC023714]|uniref:YceI family protein n=1 Tax=Actinoplanes sp. NPDC023714 TaxID=3154322 RepID=UPI0033EBE212